LVWDLAFGNALELGIWSLGFDEESPEQSTGDSSVSRR
jgi:hypothetical protein